MSKYFFAKFFLTGRQKFVSRVLLIVVDGNFFITILCEQQSLIHLLTPTTLILFFQYLIFFLKKTFWAAATNWLEPKGLLSQNGY
jgi:hypothetical protein